MPFYQPDPNSKTIVNEKNEPVNFQQYKDQGGAASSANMKFPDVVAGLPPGAGAPATVGAETPAGSLNTDTTASPLGNLQLALRDALNEAGRRRVEKDLGAISGVVEGATPGSMGSIVNLIRNSVSTPVESVFKDIITAKEKEQELEVERKKTAITTLSTLADSGALLGMTADALMILEKQAGLPEGTSLAWKARLEKATKMEDEKAALELKYIQSQIAQNYASAAAAGNKATGAASVGFKDSKIETDARSDAASLLDNVSAGNMDQNAAYKRLRLLYSPQEASDDALRGLLDIAPPQVATPPLTNTGGGIKIDPRTGMRVDNIPPLGVKLENGQIKFIDTLSNNLFKK